MVALLKIKPQPNPAESSSAFFMPVNTLFFQNLRENEKIRKSVLHALIERIQAYPDRKVEVKFRIGEKTEGTGGGQKLDPHLSTYPVGSIPSVRVTFNYIHTWQYIPLSTRG